MYIILLETNNHIKVVIIYLNIDYERRLAYIWAECQVHDGLLTIKVLLLKLNMIYRFLCQLLQSLKVIKILYKIPQALEDITSCGSDTSS